ncbi:MAG: hypothetical protein ACI4U2_00380 [Christensenellaceae bacterium]
MTAIKKNSLPLWARVVSIVLAAIVLLFAALGITLLSVWGNEIATVSSFTQLLE